MNNDQTNLFGGGIYIGGGSPVLENLNVLNNIISTTPNPYAHVYLVN